MVRHGSGPDPSEIQTCSLPVSGPFRLVTVASLGENEGEVVGTHPSGVVVVADASIYYAGDLLRRLPSRGIHPESAGAADILAAAVHAFGRRAPEVVEGDFAFVAWDPGSQRLLIGRDPFGLRALFFRREEGGLTVATHPRGVAALFAAGRNPELSREGALRAVLFRPGSGAHTPLKGVREFPAGSLATIPSSEATPHPARYWNPTPDPNLGRMPSSGAAEHLGRLISEAAGERVVPGATALALSGGQDSTAVLGGIRDTRSPHTNEQIRLLSLRYPTGDRGDEAMYVDAVSDNMSLPVRWLDTDTIPLFRNVASRAQAWSHAFGHSFEGQNRALARAAVEEEACVLLTGHGGDNVFFVSDHWMMADLLREGRWRTLRHAFRARGYSGLRHLWRYCIRPALNPETVVVLGKALGRSPLAWPGEQPVPPWIAADRRETQELLQESRARFQSEFQAKQSTKTGTSRAWMILDPVFTQVTANLQSIVRDAGVELRAPLLDRRLVEFALSRPAQDFNRPGEGKVLLREAMRGKLPDLLVDPRPSTFKTGVATEYFGRRFPREIRDWAERLSSEPWHLEDLGIVDVGAVTRILEASVETLAAWQFHLVCTLSTEQWLRSLAVRKLQSP